MANQPPLILAVDGGGTWIRAALTTPEGDLLGMGRAPGDCLQALSPPELAARLRPAIAEACAAAGSPRPRLMAAAFALAGLGGRGEDPLVRRELLRAAGADETCRVVTTTDLEAALQGAFAGREGIVVVAGTGSSALGSDAGGRRVRAGGFGPLVDDAGSALALGRMGLEACARALDGRGPPTRLLEVLPGSGTTGDLLRTLAELMAAPDARRRIARLAPLVLACAREGDDCASRIARKGAAELAALAAAVARGLGATHPRVALVGGLSRDPDYAGLFAEGLRERLPGGAVRAPLLPPLQGATLLALASSGRNPRPEAIRALQAWPDADESDEDRALET